MSTKHGIRILAGVALASSLLLAGCSSSGTLHTAAGSATTGTSTPTSTDTSVPGSDVSTTASSAPSSQPSSSDSSSDSSSGLYSDPGCAAAMDDATSDALTKLNPNDPGATQAAIKGVADKLHADAKKATKPADAAAINKVGDDYAKLAAAISGGSFPDTSKIMDDVSNMSKVCVG